MAKPNLFVGKEIFLTQVYLTLIVQLFVTFFIVYSFRSHPTLSKATKHSIFLYLIVLLGLIILLTLPMPIWLKLLIFTIFAMVNGGLLHNVSAIIPQQFITQALLGTIGIFIALTFVGVIIAMMGINLSWMGFILFGALIGLIVASLIVLIFDKNKSSILHKVILIIGLILFSVYITYNTNIMLQKEYNEDFVTAAIDLYLNFINIFIRLLAFDAN